MSDRGDLVAKRQRYIQRQVELDKGTVNVDIRSRKPMGRPSFQAK